MHASAEPNQDNDDDDDDRNRVGTEALIAALCLPLILNYAANQDANAATVNLRAFGSVPTAACDLSSQG